MDPTATGPRPAYDLTRTTQEQRIATKVEELAGTSLARSRKALFNFWKEYRSAGIAGVDARLHPKGRKRLAIAKADPRLVAVIDRELDSRVNMPTSSRRHCAALVRRTLQAMYPGDQICAIKDTTLQGYINERDAGRYSFAKSTTRRTSSNSLSCRRANRLGAGDEHGPRISFHSQSRTAQITSCTIVDFCGAAAPPASYPRHSPIADGGSQNGSRSGRYGRLART